VSNELDEGRDSLNTPPLGIEYMDDPAGGGECFRTDGPRQSAPELVGCPIIQLS
jgi:hypothetical protein